MGNIVAFDPAKFQATMLNLAKAATTRVGFLKMAKTGDWSYGADEEPVTEDDHVFIDPNGFVHGWQCWADTEQPGVQSALLGDVLAPMFEPLPERPTAVPPSGRPWSEVRGMSVLLGDEKLTYSTTSVGGLNALAELAGHYAVQFKKDPKAMIAEVSLACDSYKHKNKTFGRVYTPVFNIVAWHAELPSTAPEVAEPKKIAAKKAPAKKVRRAA